MGVTHGLRPMTDLEVYNESPVVQSLKKKWVIDGNLYNYYARDRANNMVTLRNMHTNKLVHMLWTDFIKKRENVYTIRRAAELLNRHISWLTRQVWYGVFKSPLYATPDKKRVPGMQGYFTEADIHEMRDIMAENRHRRKDGLPANKAYIPTKQELTRRMGRGMLTYTRLGDGRFVPIWEETI